jgi:predicted nucleic acid-binding protein
VKVFFDTSVLVSSLVAKHPHHERAMAVVARVLRRVDEAHVAAHGVAETYAVLTTLPVVPRIGPDMAGRLIRDNILAHFRIVVLEAREYLSVVGSLPEKGIMGGAVYDAIHVACAQKAAAKRLYTFNVAHFQRIAPEWNKRVVAP